jgi:hypothetical protein
MKKALSALALGAALSFTAVAAPYVSPVAPVRVQDDDRREDQRERHPEYYRNSYYRTGNREGYEDYRRKARRRVHRHHYHGDDDRRAHDYGYEEGWRGRRYDPDHDR